MKVYTFSEVCRPYGAHDMGIRRCGSGGGAIETGSGMGWRSGEQVLKGETFKARADHGMAGERIVVGDP